MAKYREEPMFTEEEIGEATKGIADLKKRKERAADLREFRWRERLGLETVDPAVYKQYVRWRGRRWLKMEISQPQRFLEGLTEDERREILKLAPGPLLRYFVNGAKWQHDRMKPLLMDNLPVRRELPQKGPATNPPRKLKPKQEYLDAIRSTALLKGRYNLTAIGRKLGLRDSKTVREHLQYYQIPIK